MSLMYKLPDTIFITGYAGSGKDTLGMALVKYAGFTRLSFADALKEEVADHLGITVVELNARKAEFRQLLQEWGTRKRDGDEDYWVKEWYRRRVLIGGPVVCSDMRYPNEAFFGLEIGGLLLRVVVSEEERIARLKERDGRFDPRWGNHPSELHIPNLPVHAVVPGDLPEECQVPVIAAVYSSLLDVCKSASCFGCVLK